MYVSTYRLTCIQSTITGASTAELDSTAASLDMAKNPHLHLTPGVLLGVRTQVRAHIHDHVSGQDPGNLQFRLLVNTIVMILLGSLVVAMTSAG